MGKKKEEKEFSDLVEKISNHLFSLEEREELEGEFSIPIKSDVPHHFHYKASEENLKKITFVLWLSFYTKDENIRKLKRAIIKNNSLAEKNSSHIRFLLTEDRKALKIIALLDVKTWEKEELKRVVIALIEEIKKYFPFK